MERAATGGTSVAEIRQRLEEVEHELRAGAGDVVALAQEQLALQAALVAADARDQARANVGYRARLAETQADFAARLELVMERVGEHAAPLIFALQDAEKLILEMNRDGTSDGSGRTMEEILGVPLDFASRALQVLSDRRVQWNYDTALPEWMRAVHGPARPKLAGQPTYTLRARQMDMRGNTVQDPNLTVLG